MSSGFPMEVDGIPVQVNYSWDDEAQDVDEFNVYLAIDTRQEQDIYNLLNGRQEREVYTRILEDVKNG